MDLKEKLDRQIARAVRDAVIKLSRNEDVDPGSLALALASGQTVDSLIGEAQKKTDRRTDVVKSKEHPNAPPAVSPANPQADQFVHPLTPKHVRQAAEPGANRAPRPTEPAGPQSGEPHPNPLSSKDFEKVTHG